MAGGDPFGFVGFGGVLFDGMRVSTLLQMFGRIVKMSGFRKPTE
jgi:hypothetical protein